MERLPVAARYGSTSSHRPRAWAQAAGQGRVLLARLVTDACNPPRRVPVSRSLTLILIFAPLT